MPGANIRRPRPHHRRYRTPASIASSIIYSTQTPTLELLFRPLQLLPRKPTFLLHSGSLLQDSMFTVSRNYPLSRPGRVIRFRRPSQLHYRDGGTYPPYSIQHVAFAISVQYLHLISPGVTRCTPLVNWRYHRMAQSEPFDANY